MSLSREAAKDLVTSVEQREFWITRHFREYQEMKPWTFCWRITVEGFIVAALALGTLDFFLPVDGIQTGSGGEPFFLLDEWGYFFLVVIVAPVLETLLFQALPISIARILRGPFYLQIIISTALFAAAHFAESFAVGVGAGIVGGFYCAFSYAHWTRSSHRTAFWVTTVSHAMHNGLISLILLVWGDF